MSGNKFQHGNYTCVSKEESPQLIGIGVSLSSPNLLNSALSLMLATSSSESDLSEPEHLIEEFEVAAIIGKLKFVSKLTIHRTC